jgi:hypothetical protein
MHNILLVIGNFQLGLKLRVSKYSSPPLQHEGGYAEAAPTIPEAGAIVWAEPLLKKGNCKQEL